MDNILEKLNTMISEEKETLSVLPKNTKKDIEEYLQKLEQTRIKYKKLRKLTVKEIKIRYRRILRKKVKPEVKQLEDNIKEYENIFLLYNDNTSYEKMGLDVISYNLNHFYKSDLNLINEYIFNCIKYFEKCNIKLTPQDFKYNQYTYKYMSVFFEEMNNDINNSEKIKSVFEEIYWKCSDIMKYINLNIYYLYYKNQKEIDKYYKNETNKILNKFKLKTQDVIEQYLNLKEEYFKKYNQDESVLLNKFIFKGFDINRYTYNEIENEYDKFIKTKLSEMNNSELQNLNDNIYKLSNTLYEYKNYIKYSYILDDMKKRNVNASKTEYSIEKDLKKIASEESKLMKLNAKIDKANNKSSRFGKNENNNGLEKKCNEQLKVIEDLYVKLEESIINKEIKKMFEENATIYRMLLFVSHHYSYFCECITKNKTEEEKETLNKEKEIEDLKEFLSNPQFNVLIKNLRINDDKKIEQIIKDRYYLFNIEIQEEDLKPQNLDDLLGSVDKIVLYNNIKNSEISVEDIKFMCELKKITEN